RHPGTPDRPAQASRGGLGEVGSCLWASPRLLRQLLRTALVLWADEHCRAVAPFHRAADDNVPHRGLPCDHRRHLFHSCFKPWIPRPELWAKEREDEMGDAKGD